MSPQESKPKTNPIIIIVGVFSFILVIIVLIIYFIHISNKAEDDAEDDSDIVAVDVEVEDIPIPSKIDEFNAGWAREIGEKNAIYIGSLMVNKQFVARAIIFANMDGSYTYNSVWINANRHITDPNSFSFSNGTSLLHPIYNNCTWKPGVSADLEFTAAGDYYVKVKVHLDIGYSLNPPDPPKSTISFMKIHTDEYLTGGAGYFVKVDINHGLDSAKSIDDSVKLFKPKFLN